MDMEMKMKMFNQLYKPKPKFIRSKHIGHCEETCRIFDRDSPIMILGGKTYSESSTIYKQTLERALNERRT